MAVDAPGDRQRALTLGRIRLRHLQCFLAVAQHGNLKRAAQALSITQPAVTKTLHELEDLLGAPLFVRGRKGAVLTAPAEAFMRHAHASVNALTQAVDSVLHGAEVAALRLGVLPTVAVAFLPAVTARFVAAHPLVPLRVTTGRNSHLLEQLRSRELDAVIGRLSDPDLMAGLSFEHLYAEPMVIVHRPGHPLAGASAPQALAGLATHPLVLPLAGTLIRQVADGFLARHGLSPAAGVVETLDASFARALVLRGDNLWFTPSGAALPELQAGTVARLPVTITPDEPVGLMQRTESPPNPALAAWVDAVREQAVVRRGDTALPGLVG